MDFNDYGNFFKVLENAGITFDRIQKNNIIERIKTIVSYQPKIGIMGKTGVGKSSLANALFGKDICKISDISSCTREPQEVLLSLADDSGLIL